MTKRHPQKKKRKKKTSGKCSQDEEQQKREVANSRCSQVSTKFVTGEGTDEQPDFTSKLPNETLQHIISFLPLQSAAQTRLLSSHWRQAWNVVSDKTGRVEDLVPVTATFLSSVNWVLNPSTHAWKLRFQTEDGKIEMIATTGVNNKLRLDFSGGDKTNLPRYYDLELEITDEHCLQHPSSYPISSADYFQVKSLCLVGVDQLSGEMVSSLIWEHLHSLERLEIRECHSLTGLIISPDYGSRTLERLEIRECHSLTSLIISPDNVSHTLKHISIIDCDHLESVTTDLPYTLNSFRYRAQSFPRDLNMRRVSFMPEDVMFDFRKGTAGYNDNEDYGGLQFYLNVVWNLNQARHITISQWTFQVRQLQKIIQTRSNMLYLVRNICTGDDQTEPAEQFRCKV